MSKSPLPCLIGGTGRSGTTVVRRVLAQHPQVAAVPFETRFLVDPDGIVDFYDSWRSGWSPAVYEVKLRRLRRLLTDVGAHDLISFGKKLSDSAAGVPGQPGGGRSAIKKMAVAAKRSSTVQRIRPRYSDVDLQSLCQDYPRLVDELIHGLVDFTYDGRWVGTPVHLPSKMTVGPREDQPDVPALLARFVRSVFGCIADPRGATHMVEDSPFNLLSFDRILALLPDAKLIHIYRDPRDVVASYMNKRWAPSDPVQGARLYKKLMDQWTVVRASLPEGSFLEVALEELVDNPEPVLRSLCGFWALPWDDSLMEFDLGHAHAGRFKSDLTVSQQAEVTKILEGYLGAYGPA